MSKEKNKEKRNKILKKILTGYGLSTVLNPIGQFSLTTGLIMGSKERKEKKKLDEDNEKRRLLKEVLKEILEEDKSSSNKLKSETEKGSDNKRIESLKESVADRIKDA